jgi:hypothetical protein
MSMSDPNTTKIVRVLVCYYGVTFYALSVSNVAEFHSACGERVWPFMLAHTLISLLIALGSLVAGYSNQACCIGVSDDFILYATMATIALFCAISLPVGVPILSSAATSKTCEHAMGQSPGSSSMWLVYSGLVGLVLTALGGAVALLMLLFLIGQIVHDHFNAQPQVQPQSHSYSVPHQQPLDFHSRP